MSADSESMLAQFDDAGRRLPFIIQFTGPVQQAWKQAVEQTGARPNNVEGWGQVDLANTLVLSAGWTNAYYDMTNSAYAMGTGKAKLYSFIPSGTNRISITLCWSDYPASLSAACQLVNDLDLTVITPDGVVHYPNGLTSADRLNNVEGVDVSCVTPGTIQIRVSGYNVPSGPQPYALVIHGAGSAFLPALGDYDGDGKSDPAAYQDGLVTVAFSGSGYNLNFARIACKIHPPGRSRPRQCGAESGLTPTHPP